MPLSFLRSGRQSETKDEGSVPAPKLDDRFTTSSKPMADFQDFLENLAYWHASHARDFRENSLISLIGCDQEGSTFYRKSDPRSGILVEFQADQPPETESQFCPRSTPEISLNLILILIFLNGVGNNFTMTGHFDLYHPQVSEKGPAKVTKMRHTSIIPPKMTQVGP